MSPVPRPNIRNNTKPSKAIIKKLRKPSVYSSHFIKERIPSQSTKSAPEASCIPYFCLKKLPDAIIDRITALFNVTMRLSHFPTPWKSSVIIPIPKSSQDLSDSANYRPINLIPTLSKVLEHLIKEHLTDLIVNHSTLLNKLNTLNFPEYSIFKFSSIHLIDSTKTLSFIQTNISNIHQRQNIPKNNRPVVPTVGLALSTAIFSDIIYQTVRMQY